MTVRGVLTTASASGVGLCVAVYLAAVGVNADVEGEANWWPYWWLVIVLGVAAVLAVAWVLLVLVPNEGRTDSARPDGEDQAEAVFVETGAPRAVEPAAAPLPAEPEEAPDPGVYTMGDMVATRAANGTWGVKWIKSNQRVGIIREHDNGTFEAFHVDMGSAGVYGSVADAVLGIWEVD